ncbi:MAG: 23S rRNA (uracil(1939)-C(5))-methyltransferase RlmD [Lachnospiraceae bacterium]|jgi:23S rRNA (uracil1939-C5)-methyltransferase|nr:23S rRNA (uracil(1939)-C(5))-methyltransferase RlmD [Lachnospiraceae bacterium]
MEKTKNELVELQITDIGTEGEGIGKAEGYTIFVKDAMPGDKVRAKLTKVKKNFAYARLDKVLTPSKDRVVPVCKYARQCGGCQIQAMDYPAQCAFKQNKVKNDLIRIGGFDEELVESVMEPIVGMEEPFHYRNKAQFPVGTDKKGDAVAGFYAGRTHDIIANTNCALGRAENRYLLDFILSFMNKYEIQPYDEKTHKGLVRHVLLRAGFSTQEIMICFVINGNSFPYTKPMIEGLRSLPKIGERIKSICFSPNTRNTNVIMGDSYKVMWGEEYITDRIGEVTFRISPLSFYQVNPVQTKKLYEQVLEYADLKGTETVWDLYCGIGTISLFLAGKAGEVHGVEIVPQAVADAKENAILNGIENANFYDGKAEEVLPRLYKEQNIKADVIVTDPPRKGCDEKCLETMVKMAPHKIVYVSCDPATLARDLKYLCENGYKLERVRAFDQFPMTVHVETVVQLVNIGVKPDYTVRLEVDVDEFYKTVGEDKRNYLDSEEYKKIKAKIKINRASEREFI